MWIEITRGLTSYMKASYMQSYFLSLQIFVSIPGFEGQ